MDYKDALSQIIELQKSKSNVSPYLGEWIEWFQGYVPSYHKYYVYNGKKKNYKRMLSMKMAKQSCEDWASLLMNEKVQIVVADQDKLDDLLINLDFYNKANEAVEKGFALSMCALVINVDGIEANQNEKGELVITSLNKAKLKLSNCAANHLYPLNWENGTCTECGFVFDDTKKKRTVIHLLNEEGTYDIYSQIEDKQDSSKKQAFLFHTGSSNPWFVIIHPRTVNNLDVDSDLPISIYANSIDTLKAIDMKYDSYHVEFLQGKKRTYISAKLSEVNKENGEVESTYDPNDTVIYQLPEQTSINGEQKNLVVNVTDALRAAEHSQAIQDELNFFSKQVGLGVDYYRFEKGRVMTATQVISEKSDTFRNMKKHEGILEKAVITLIKSIMYASNEFTLNKFNKPDEVEVNFDDSIIEDKTTEKDNDRKDTESGIMSKVQFRMKWYGEDEETAKKSLKDAFGDVDLAQRIATFSEALSSGAITARQYVDQVFPDLEEAKKEALAEELKSSNSISAQELGLYNPNANQ